jgi:hypothetical protein
MNLTELTTRLESGENLHTEFKEWGIQPDVLGASMTALRFAHPDNFLIR